MAASRWCSDNVGPRPCCWARSSVPAMISTFTTDAVVIRCPGRRWYQQPDRSSYTATVR